MTTLQNKTILITGGTGSFGEAATRHLLARGVKEIRIFSRDETKQDLMRHTFEGKCLSFYIGDVRNRASLDKAMEGVDLVFHAAALKQVPSCESFPEQAVQTNILGSENVIESAYRNKVERAVFLSTDKAVYPLNTMGLTKALMEKMVKARARSIGEKGTILTCVRYGNVLYSRGSVVPLFINQIRKSKHLTLTVPTMTRFLMTLDEAFDLIEVALTQGNQGDSFIRKAPAADVLTIAEAVKQLYNVDNKIDIIGIRPGEKLHETLATFNELAIAEDLGTFFRIPLKASTPPCVVEEDYTSNNAEQMQVAEVIALLQKVPELQEDLALWHRFHSSPLIKEATL